MHRRSVAAALEALVDRDRLDEELRGGDGPRSVVAVTLRDAPPDPTAHAVLLDQAIRRIRSIVREPTGVHQVGEHDLVVVIEGNHYVADSVAGRIRTAFADPFSVGGADLVVAVGTGVADVDPLDPGAAVHRADLDAQRPATR